VHSATFFEFFAGAARTRCVPPNLTYTRRYRTLRKVSIDVNPQPIVASKIRTLAMHQLCAILSEMSRKFDHTDIIGHTAAR
jgi:hypothetical protein